MLEPSTYVLQALFYVAQGIKSIAGTHAYTASSVLINAHAPRPSLGAVNGFCQASISSLYSFRVSAGCMVGKCEASCMRCVLNMILSVHGAWTILSCGS